MKILLAASFTLLLSSSALPADEEHHHEHTAPHGGTLVVLGDEFAHLELVLDPETGSLTAYVLDGEAENAVRIAQESIEIKIKDSSVQDNGAATDGYTVSLKTVANVLTGETAGDSSEFEIQSDRLKGARKFGAVIRKIDIKGQRFTNVDFRFPEGNE
jgi:hypothetical protein